MLNFLDDGKNTNDPNYTFSNNCIDNIASHYNITEMVRLSNNSDRVRTNDPECLGTGRLVFSKQDYTDSYTRGQPIIFNLVVSNSGQGYLTGVYTFDDVSSVCDTSLSPLQLIYSSGRDSISLTSDTFS